MSHAARFYLMTWLFAAAGAVRFEVEEQKKMDMAAGPPPAGVLDEVHNGYQEAHLHAEEVYAAAMEVRKNITARMRKHVERGSPDVPTSIVLELNTAIHRSKKAMDLKALVESHNVLVTRFAKDVEGFMETKKKSDLARQVFESNQSSESLKQDSTLTTATQKIGDEQSSLGKLLCLHQRSEILKVGEMLELYKTVRHKGRDAREKHSELEADVHPRLRAVEHDIGALVKDGTRAAQTWANAEMREVCVKYVGYESGQVRFSKVQDIVVQTKEEQKARSGRKASLCNKVMHALANYFSATGADDEIARCGDLAWSVSTTAVHSLVQDAESVDASGLDEMSWLGDDADTAVEQ